MRVRTIDKKGDWNFGHGQSDYATQAAAIALDVKLKIREWYEDCFFDMNAGIDWKTRMGKHNQKDLLDADIKRIASSVEGVMSIVNFESTCAGRQYTCTFGIYQPYSTDILEVEFKNWE